MPQKKAAACLQLLQGGGRLEDAREASLGCHQEPWIPQRPGEDPQKGVELKEAKPVDYDSIMGYFPLIMACFGV